MSMNVNNVNGGGNGYGITWNNNRSQEDVETNNAEKQTTANANQERKDVNPDDVMKFLANNNIFIDVQLAKLDAADGKIDGIFNTDLNSVEADMQDRIAGYMERFEEIYAIIEQEFGAELAPSVMDLVMDKLMGM